MHAKYGTTLYLQLKHQQVHPTTYVFVKNKKINFQLHTLIWRPDAYRSMYTYQVEYCNLN